MKHSLAACAHPGVGSLKAIVGEGDYITSRIVEAPAVASSAVLGQAYLESFSRPKLGEFAVVVLTHDVWT
jgi:hypothetical protein